MALRPEGTASVVRAFVQHRPSTPWKVWYATPAFRYERPQAGRLPPAPPGRHRGARHATTPTSTSRSSRSAARSCAALGLRRVALAAQHLGDGTCRPPRYVEALRPATSGARAATCATSDRDGSTRTRMRVLDCKRRRARDGHRATRPRIIDHLCDGVQAHFDRVQAGSARSASPSCSSPRLVRGLDYYTHTTFEFQRERARQRAGDASVGGGRYDGLVEELGGPPTPGIGFGIGHRADAARLRRRGRVPGARRAASTCSSSTSPAARAARDLTAELRRRGHRAPTAPSTAGA